MVVFFFLGAAFFLGAFFLGLAAACRWERVSILREGKKVSTGTRLKGETARLDFVRFKN